MDKRQKLGHVKGINKETKTITALVSTTQWDRMDERFAKGAWDLGNYLKNAVVLWAHNSTDVPIAKSLSIQETDAGLLSEMKFDQGSPRAMEIFRLYDEGFLNAFSVGFIPKKWQMEPMGDGTERKGLVFTDAELFEYSAVPVPANPGALVSHEMADMLTKTLGPGFFKAVPGKEEFLMVVGPEEPEESSPPADTPPAPAAASEEKADLEKQLKYLIDLSKTTKASGLDETKIKLVQQAVKVLQEIVDQSTSVGASGIKDLQKAIDAYGQAIKSLFPDSKVLMEKVLKQIDKALDEK